MQASAEEPVGSPERGKSLKREILRERGAVKSVQAVQAIQEVQEVQMKLKEIREGLEFPDRMWNGSDGSDGSDDAVLRGDRRRSESDDDCIGERPERIPDT